MRGLGHDDVRLEVVVEGDEQRLGAGDRAEQRQHEVGEDVAVAVQRRDDQRVARGGDSSAKVASISCGSYGTSGWRSAAASISSLSIPS